MPVPLADLALEDVDHALGVNAGGIFVSMKYEIAAMLGSGGGAIVNMSTTAGIHGVPGIAGYVAGKHAILGVTKVAALDYAPKKIRVNAVAPGPIDSHRPQQLTDEQRPGIIAGVPLGRLGQPGEVAATITWLCSDHASFVSGATLTIGGAKLAGGA